MWRLLSAAAVVAACQPDRGVAGRFTGTLRLPQRDSVRLDVPIAGHPCLGEAAMLIQGVDAAAGVLVLLAPGSGPDTGSFAIIAPQNDIALRQARVALRYDPGDQPHAFALDSGSVVLRRDGGRAQGTVVGSGYDAVAGTRPVVEATLRDVAIGAAGVACSALP